MRAEPSSQRRRPCGHRVTIAGQSGRGGSLVGVGQLLLEKTLGAMAGLLSPRFVDIVRPLSRIRQDRDLVGAHLEKSAGHEEQLLLAIVADSHRSGGQWREQRERFKRRKSLIASPFLHYDNNSLIGPLDAGSAIGKLRPPISKFEYESSPTACKYVWNRLL